MRVTLYLQLILAALILISSLDYAYSESKVKIYVTEIACSSCSTNPYADVSPYSRYINDLEKALKDLGVTDVKAFLLKKEELDELYRDWDVPDDMHGSVVVDIDDKYFFINLVSVKVITDFLINYKDQYDRIVIFKDPILEVYKILKEDGSIVECEVKDSINECIKKENMMPYFASALPLIVISGLIDGINPCAFAVLLFFVSFLLVTTRSFSWKKARQKILLVGSFFIVGVYLAYLMIGLAIIRTFSVVGFTHIFGKIGAFIVIILGIINIKDYFHHGKPFLSISSSRWVAIRKYLRICTFPSAFIAGFLTSLSEFPCTGGIYVAILGMLAFRSTFMEGFIYLIIYNLAFIFPLIIILLFSSRKRVIRFSIEKWQQHQGKFMRLLSGLMMIMIGIFLLLSGLV